MSNAVSSPARPTPRPLPAISYPEQLPVSARRDEIARAIAAHQVVIVSGETGSGKTTQLPKICLELGRGRVQRIAHTQPRRLAATSVARRVAEELGTPLGEVVGYQIRFSERAGPNVCVKLMTDGVLLAETQRDRALRRYDTIIIDEAHERSLNIDFLLGYLKPLLARRRDLKLIITSATIDAERFARHFTDARGRPAPVIAVSGRLYPVAVRYRPVQRGRDEAQATAAASNPSPKTARDEERDLIDAVVDAVAECAREPSSGGADDILVFLPGEREIREAAEALRKHHPVDTEVLPLYARLSQAEQTRIFHPQGNRRRVVLATNVAETSLTVPGIGFVVDSGLARVKRYATRQKVEQLRIEPVSQASANQRAGRCGRIGPGLCIRLYDEADFQRRPAFTEPEVLRSSLAAVILRMQALGLADVAAFPFVDPPSGRAVADGWGQLLELGALTTAPSLPTPSPAPAGHPLPRVGEGTADSSPSQVGEGTTTSAHNSPLPPGGRGTTRAAPPPPLGGKEWAPSPPAPLPPDGRGEKTAPSPRYTLTPLGRELARLPTDPRIGRMILAARDQQCLTEMLVIAAALSVQDPRERPLAAREAAEAAHAKFADPKSEFLSWLKLWRWYGEQVAHKGSQRKLTALLRQNFLSPVRLREWHDIHGQLAAIVGEHGWRLNTTDATYEQLHTALLAGLLGNVGCKSETATSERRDAHVYQGAREIRFALHPGSTLAKKGGNWVVAAELVETTRLYARCVARIEPVWVERVARHLLQRNYSDPRWEKKAGQVVAFERATLYGLPVYNGRRVAYGRVNTREAREIFIRDALVPGDIDTPLAFVAHNRKLVAEIEQLEHRARRPDILVDDALIYAFYDRQLPADISQTATLERWVKGLAPEAARALLLNRDDLMRHDAQGVTTHVFPKSLSWHGVEMALAYHFEPGSPRDGVTLTVPLFALNQLDAARCDWLVPGMVKEKAQALLRTLPQKLRRHCVPLPDAAAAFYDRWYERLADPANPPDTTLTDALIAYLGQRHQVRAQAADFKPEQLPAHLTLNFKVVDQHGRMLAGGRNLAQLRAELGGQAQDQFRQLAGRDSEVAQALAHENLTDWTFGELPELLEIQRHGQSLVGYPALTDRGSHCELEVHDDPHAARRAHRQGLLRLFKLALREQVKFQEKNLPDVTRLGMLYLTLGTQEQLRDQIIDCALAEACLQEPWPADQTAFRARCLEAKTRLGLLTRETARLALAILTDWAALQKKLPQAKPHPASHADLQAQTAALVPPDFLAATPPTQRTHLPRYLKAASARIDKLRADPARDTRLMTDMAPLLTQYQRARAARKGAPDPLLDDFRWLLEELRVALYAQTLRTPMPVSVKRLQKAWEAMQR